MASPPQKKKDPGSPPAHIAHSESYLRPKRRGTADSERPVSRINRIETLPEHEFYRQPLPPPAPLPTERMPGESRKPSPSWFEQTERRKRVENIVGLTTLAILVITMLLVLWTRMSP